MDRWKLKKTAQAFSIGGRSDMPSRGRVLISFSLACFVGGSDLNSVERACSVFCHGPILDAVQTAEIFNDSKYFVDMPLLVDPEDALDAFSSEVTDPTDVTQLELFLSTYFADPGSDVIVSSPTDWSSEPSTLLAITNDTLRDFALSINAIWPDLYRTTSSDVADNPQRHSLLYRQYPMVVPGGRFRESYYWDSYWIVRGLLMCDMVDSAKAVTSNLLDDIETFGFVPNGGRVYYTNRSQPPFLTLMVSVVVRAAEDVEYGRDALDPLISEYQWWLENRHVDVTVDGTTYKLARFHSNSTTPRPESYTEDVETQKEAAALGIDDIYAQLNAGAETGWDYSSRWMCAQGSSQQIYNLTSLCTCDIIPVDLNAVLYRVERSLAWLCEYTSMTDDAARHAWLRMDERHITAVQDPTAQYFLDQATARADAIQAVLWNASAAKWSDVSIGSPLLMHGSAADWGVPLWAGLAIPLETDVKEAIVDSLSSSGMIQAGGLVTTLIPSGQQWDSPNAWAPEQHMTVLGLLGLGVTSADKLGSQLRDRWVNSNLLAFQDSGMMYEKYDAGVPGQYGGGGEYTPQAGFGWTNGVALEFITSM